MRVRPFFSEPWIRQHGQPPTPARRRAASRRGDAAPARAAAAAPLRRSCWRLTQALLARRRQRTAMRCCSRAIAQRFLGRIPDALATLATPRAASSALQPPVRGARPLLRGAAAGAAGDRGVPARGEHQPRAAGELGHARGPLPHAGAARTTPPLPASHVATLRAPAAGGRDRDRTVCRRRPRGGRSAGPRVPAQARRPHRGACGCWRASASRARCTTMPRCCSRPCSSSRPTTAWRAPGIRRSCSPSCTATRRRAPSSTSSWPSEPDNRPA